MRACFHMRLTLTPGVKLTSRLDPRLTQSGPTLIVMAGQKPPLYHATCITLITSSVQRWPGARRMARAIPELRAHRGRRRNDSIVAGDGFRMRFLANRPGLGGRIWPGAQAPGRGE